MRLTGFEFATRREVSSDPDDLKHEVLELRRLVWLLVNSNGGRVSLFRSELEEFDPARSILQTYTTPAGLLAIEAKKP